MTAILDLLSRFLIGAIILACVCFKSQAFIMKSRIITGAHRFADTARVHAAPSSRGAKKSQESCGNDNVDSPMSSSSSTVAFKGAGCPRPELPPEDLPVLLMQSLALNDFPHVDAGLESMWNFAGDTTRHIFNQNMTDFIESAHETADRFPTSFYGAAMNGKSWSMETSLNRVGGEDGWIATQVMKTITSDGRLRRWQWELRKNRRPPNLDCWFVESIGSSDRKGQFEPE